MIRHYRIHEVSGYINWIYFFHAWKVRPNTPEAKQLLIEKGYDPKMGARPMRRIVQKTVENTVASAILSGAIGSGSVLEIAPENLEI